MPSSSCYDSYIDSKIEWVGEIPSHWEIKPNKWVMKKSKRLSDKWKGEPILSLTTNGVIIRDLDAGGKMPATFDGYQYVYNGELLMCLFDIDVTPRCVGRVMNDGITSPAYSSFVMLDGASQGYFYYYYLMVDNTKELLHLAKNLRHSFTEEQLGLLKVPVPPMNEQIAITNYLDTEISKVDILIQEAKNSIDDYVEWRASAIYKAITKGLDSSEILKDSKCSWLGEIPSRWNVCSLKRLTLKIGSGKTPSGGAEVYQDEGVLFLRSQNIYNSGLVLDGVSHISDEINEDMKNTQVQYRDVLLNITGGSIGRCCLYDLEDVPANVNQHVCIIRTDEKLLLPEYLRYFWNSASGPMVVSQYQTGGNRPGLNFEQIGRTLIPLCSIEEQHQIVCFLDNVVSKIDELISEKKALILDLELYKKSLICEVVTGKRKVV